MPQKTRVLLPVPPFSPRARTRVLLSAGARARIGEDLRIDGPAIYQHPLAYLLGLEGIALLRAFSGVYDRDFTVARLREIQALLDSGEELGEGVEAGPMTTSEGYARWAELYDDPGNQLVDLEQPVVREILDGLPLGVALDAACGTGRHTAYVASLGHEVIGVDTSAEMLTRAREKVPGGTFYEADLHDLPLADDSVDVVVCALALSHVPDLAPAFAEFVRVLRRGGHLVLSDSRGLIGDIGLPLVKTGPDGSFGYMPVWSRLVSDYLAAALPLGLQVRRCEEPRRPSPLVDDDGTDLYDGSPPPSHVPGEPPNIWALHRFCPAATNAAWRGNPAAIIWHFQLSEG
jgi:ubiquinone/menaquinone biosynthesis C-methylase UbiE